MKKKVVSLLLAAAMTTAALAGCGSSNGSSSSDASTGADSTSATSASASTDGEKKDAAGEKIAMITDSGDITDESFNQITWETVCAYGDANGVEYEYYKPAEDTDEERINSIDLAVSEGATVVVMPGYLFGPAIAEEQDTYPDVTFIAVDVTESDIVKNGKAVDLGKNVYICSFEEEQAGYLAGYAAVKDGYTSLGFLGGIAVPAVIRFGYGLTSAMKGLPSAINNALDSYFSGNFSELGGTAQQLGLKDGDYIGLPTDSESWGFTTFTQDQYETVLAGIRDGSIEISSDTENQPKVGSHVTVDYIS